VKVRWEAAGHSDVGRVRQGNEDAFLVDVVRGVFLVADGMGGHVAGEIASAVVREAVGGTLRRGVDRGLRADDLADAMAASFVDAHRAIAAHVLEDPRTDGMGTTATACVVCDDGTYRLGHIGDSRAYRMRGGELVQITRDHTWVQREVDAGRLSPRAARSHHLSHVLARALGTGGYEDPDVHAGTLAPGDLLLLTTDGLTNMLDDANITRILARGAELRETVQTLIDEANARGGPDNVTAVLVRVLEGAPAEG
jgi:PPM family protein phosphatase